MRFVQIFRFNAFLFVFMSCVFSRVFILTICFCVLLRVFVGFVDFFDVLYALGTLLGVFGALFKRLLARCMLLGNLGRS